MHAFMRDTLHSWRQMAHVTFALGWSDFLLKYRGSVFGYLWSLIGPLVQFLVIYYVFVVMVGVVIENYALYLFLGIILWEYFALTTSACINAPLQRVGVMQQISIPRTILMFSVAWTHIIIFLSRLVIFMFFAAWSGIFPVAGYAYLLVIIFQITCFSLGVGMMLAAYSLRYRDIGHLWAVVLQFFFWLTPVMYESQRTAPIFGEIRSILSDSLPQWHVLFDMFVKLQPLSVLLYDARRVLVFSQTQSFPALDHAVWLSVFCMAVFIVGLVLYRRRSKFFLQEY
jgi:ABC-type polysaccharide/polyol phosphate export permease